MTDGAAVVIIAAADRARELCERPAWITGFEHRIDSGAARGPGPDQLGFRALRPERRRLRDAGVEVAELHAPFTHQELILTAHSGWRTATRISPSGGALAGNPMFAAGLARIGHAARQILSGSAGRALGHATSGPALQQNLVCVMEAR